MTFNAEEAKKLSKENNPKFVVDNILELVKEAASNGEFAIKVRKYGFGESSLYSSKYPKRITEVLEEQQC